MRSLDILRYLKHISELDYKEMAEDIRKEVGSRKIAELIKEHGSNYKLKLIGELSSIVRDIYLKDVNESFELVEMLSPSSEVVDG